MTGDSKGTWYHSGKVHHQQEHEKCKNEREERLSSWSHVAGYIVLHEAVHSLYKRLPTRRNDKTVSIKQDEFHKEYEQPYTNNSKQGRIGERDIYTTKVQRNQWDDLELFQRI